MFSLAATFYLYTERAQQLSKMATGEEKAFAMHEFHSHLCVITMQRHFRTKLEKYAPCANSIRRWYAQYKATGCAWIGRGAENDQKLMSRPPRSTDLTPCNFLGEYVKNSVFVSRLPVDQSELRARNISAFQ